MRLGNFTLLHTFLFIRVKFIVLAEPQHTPAPQLHLRLLRGNVVERAVHIGLKWNHYEKHHTGMIMIVGKDGGPDATQRFRKTWGTEKTSNHISLSVALKTLLPFSQPHPPKEGIGDDITSDRFLSNEDYFGFEGTTAEAGIRSRQRKKYVVYICHIVDLLLCQSAVAEAKRYAVLVRAVCLPAATSSRVTRLRALKDAVAQGLRRQRPAC